MPQPRRKKHTRTPKQWKELKEKQKANRAKQGPYKIPELNIEEENKNPDQIELEKSQDKDNNSAVEEEVTQELADFGNEKENSSISETEPLAPTPDITINISSDEHEEQDDESRSENEGKVELDIENGRQLNDEVQEIPLKNDQINEKLKKTEEQIRQEFERKENFKKLTWSIDHSPYKANQNLYQPKISHLAASNIYMNAILIEQHGNFIAGNLSDMKDIHRFNPKCGNSYYVKPTGSIIHEEFETPEVNDYRLNIYRTAIKNQNTAKFTNDLIFEMEVNKTNQKGTQRKYMFKNGKIYSEFYCNSNCFFALNKIGVFQIKNNLDAGNRLIRQIIKAKEFQYQNKLRYARVAIPCSSFSTIFIRIVLEYVHSGIINFNMVLGKDFKNSLIGLVKCFDYFNLLEPTRHRPGIEKSRRDLLKKIKQERATPGPLSDINIDEAIQDLGEENDNQVYKVLSDFCKQNGINLVTPFAKEVYTAYGLDTVNSWSGQETNQGYTHGGLFHSAITMEQIKLHNLNLTQTKNLRLSTAESTPPLYIKGLGLSIKNDKEIQKRAVLKRNTEIAVASGGNPELKQLALKALGANQKIATPHTPSTGTQHVQPLPSNFENFKITAKNRDYNKNKSNTAKRSSPTAQNTDLAEPPANNKNDLSYEPPSKKKSAWYPNDLYEQEKKYHEKKSKKSSKAGSSSQMQDMDVEKIDALYEMQLEAKKILDQEKEVVDLTEASDDKEITDITPYYGEPVQSRPVAQPVTAAVSAAAVSSLGSSIIQNVAQSVAQQLSAGLASLPVPVPIQQISHPTQPPHPSTLQAGSNLHNNVTNMPRQYQQNTASHPGSLPGKTYNDNISKAQQAHMLVSHNQPPPPAMTPPQIQQNQLQPPVRDRSKYTDIPVNIPAATGRYAQMPLQHNPHQPPPAVNFQQTFQPQQPNPMHRPSVQRFDGQVNPTMPQAGQQSVGDHYRSSYQKVDSLADYGMSGQRNVGNGWR